MALDTVVIASTSPDTKQPFLELGLKEDEYTRIREILGRRPTSSELAMYSVMWSEHCSYKSSKVHLRQFGTKVPKNDSMLVGIMPHPEHAVEKLTGPTTDGLGFFTSLLTSLVNHGKVSA